MAYKSVGDILAVGLLLIGFFIFLQLIGIKGIFLQIIGLIGSLVLIITEIVFLWRFLKRR